MNDHLRRLYSTLVKALSESMPDDNSRVHEEVDLREKNKTVQSAFAQLTSKQQAVLALRFGRGYSFEETAAYLKKNIDAVRALQAARWLRSSAR